MTFNIAAVGNDVPATGALTGAINAMVGKELPVESYTGPARPLALGAIGASRGASPEVSGFRVTGNKL